MEEDLLISFILYFMIVEDISCISAMYYLLQMYMVLINCQKKDRKSLKYKSSSPQTAAR
jgi:hypothetical protein